MTFVCLFRLNTLKVWIPAVTCTACEVQVIQRIALIKLMQKTLRIASILTKKGTKDESYSSVKVETQRFLMSQR